MSGIKVDIGQSEAVTDANYVNVTGDTMTGELEIGAAGTVSTLNRLTTDGKVLVLKKDGGNIGDLGTKGGDLYLGTFDTGIRFNDANNQMLPFDPNGEANIDSTIDLGSTGARFKDFYLSGGAYLGGTSSANLLDDYEEGTWTPVASGTWTVAPTFANSKYTKVGREVTLNTDITNTPSKASATAGWLTGVPFTAVGKGIGSVTDTAIVNRGLFIAYDTRIFLTNTTFAATNFASVTYTV